MIDLTSALWIGLGVFANFLVEKEKLRKKTGSFIKDLAEVVKKAWNEPVETNKQN